MTTAVAKDTRLLTWLRSCCYTGEGIMTIRNGWARLVWQMHWGDGKPVSVATNGKALAAVAGHIKGACRANHREHGRAASALAPFLKAPDDGQLFVWEELKAWIGPPVPEEPCKGCKGTGINKHWEHDICPDCDGEGKWEWPFRAGRLCGMWVDANMLAQFTAPFSADEIDLARVWVPKEDGPLWISLGSDYVRVAAMPCNPSSDDKKRGPVFPPPERKRRKAQP